MDFYIQKCVLYTFLRKNYKTYRHKVTVIDAKKSPKKIRELKVGELSGEKRGGENNYRGGGKCCYCPCGVLKFRRLIFVCRLDTISRVIF